MLALCFQVFLRYYHVEQLNVKLAEFARIIAVCQKYVRSFVARRNYERMRRAAKTYEKEALALADVVRNVNRLVTEMERVMKSDDERNARICEERAAALAHDVRTVSEVCVEKQGAMQKHDGNQKCEKVR